MNTANSRMNLLSKVMLQTIAQCFQNLVHPAWQICSWDYSWWFHQPCVKICEDAGSTNVRNWGEFHKWRVSQKIDGKKIMANRIIKWMIFILHFASPKDVSGPDAQNGAGIFTYIYPKNGPVM